MKWFYLGMTVWIHAFYYVISDYPQALDIHPFPFSDQAISPQVYVHYGVKYMAMLFSLLATAHFAGERYAKVFLVFVVLEIICVANYFSRYGEDFFLPTFDMISVKSILYFVVIGLFEARQKYLTHATT